MQPNKLGYNMTVIENFRSVIENVRSTAAKCDRKAEIWEAILSDIILETEEFILSSTVKPKQMETVRAPTENKKFLNSPSWFLTRDEAATKATTPTGTLTNPRKNIQAYCW